MMNQYLLDMLNDQNLVARIKRKLPYMFQIAGIESSRADKEGMQVGSMRENIVVALLVYKFKEQNVNTKLPITFPECDVEVYGQPVSIKTKKGQGFSGVKLIWTVDAMKAKEFREKFYPSCDMLFINVIWGKTGNLCYIPLEVQRVLFDKIGRDEYIKLPKEGTNPRGVEIKSNALKSLLNDPQTKRIEIKWEKVGTEHTPYKRWIDMWGEE